MASRNLISNRLISFKIKSNNLKTESCDVKHSDIDFDINPKHLQIVLPKKYFEEEKLNFSKLSQRSLENSDILKAYSNLNMDYVLLSMQMENFDSSKF